MMKTLSWRKLVVMCVTWTPLGISLWAVGFTVNMWQYWTIWGAAMIIAFGQMVIGDMK